ncbi:Tfp pilus assembly protein PilF [Thermocrinis minervae]|uniref:Tfp pilus assembly protein PilF n=2 Tax=Thermocrinis minervae TaxID=381751 RepID=A0A1M6SX05_9AQUI|nr:Tfp pilus assembly protein PilF [Thermocrinis minervae]
MKTSTFLVPLVLLTFTGLSLSHAQSPVDQCVNYYAAQAYEKAIEEGKKAIKLYPSDLVSYVCLGASYLQVGDYDQAINYLKNAEKYALQKSDFMYIYGLLGLAYDGKGMLDNALFYYNKALMLARDLGNKRAESDYLSNIAMIFRRKGELDNALSYYKESLELKVDEKDRAPIYTNIAVIYLKQGNYQKAIEYFKRAMDIFDRYGNQHEYAITEINLGNAYREIRDFQNAEHYLLDGLKRAQKVGDKYLEGTAYKYLGWLYRDKGNKVAAREYLIKALRVFKEVGASSNVVEVTSDLVYLGMP